MEVYCVRERRGGLMIVRNFALQNFLASLYAAYE